MDNLFLILFFVSLLGLIIGLIKPSFVRLASRKSALMIFGGAALIFLIISMIILSSAPSKNNSQPAPAATNALDARTDEQKAEDDLKSQLQQVVGSDQTFTYQDLEIEKSDKDRPAGTKMLTIKIKVGDFWNKDSLLVLTGDLSSKLYIATFNSKVPAYDVFIWYSGDVTDQYGNKKQDGILTYAMDKKTFGKINWDNFDKAQLCNFLEQERQRSGTFDTACRVLVKI